MKITVNKKVYEMRGGKLVEVTSNKKEGTVSAKPHTLGQRVKHLFTGRFYNGD